VDEPWLDFEDDPRHHITEFGEVKVVSYQKINRILTVWPGRIDDPSIPVAFLLSSLKTVRGHHWNPNRYRAVALPHYILTDGERWCPLVEGSSNKLISYPTKFDGIMLAKGDQELIQRYLKLWVGRGGPDART